MDYPFWFWVLVAFLAGRASKLKFYIGKDRTLYDAADCGILLRYEMPAKIGR
uniref:Uncharacterized protein n=1 Tax=viral metagenome TaxID=1070528 RepID=A0A6M3LRR0_9ZZZZ